MSPPKTDPRATMAPAVLMDIEPLAQAPALARFRVRPADGSPVPEFQAGQHTTLAFESGGEVVVRYYSIASAPEERTHFEFYVVRIPARGAATQDLFDFGAGHPLWLGAPAGGFTLARTRCRHLALVATGTGIAPYVSMLRHLRARAAAGQPTPAGVTLWHGVRSSCDLGYRDELEALQASQPFPFLYLPAVSRAEQEPAFDERGLGRGRVNEVLAKVLGLPAMGDERVAALAAGIRVEQVRALMPGQDTAIFLCGNPKMIQIFEQAAQGSPYHRELVYEKYW